MEPWQTLREAIPNRTAREVARHMHVTPDFVLRWRRQPLSDESPLGTGMASPLSRTLDLINGVFAVNPDGPSLIVEHVSLHWEMLCRAHGIRSYINSAEVAEAAADLLSQATNAVNTLNLEGVSDQTLVKVIALRDAAAQAVSRIGKELFHHPQLNPQIRSIGK
jgi:hypothetical protein